MDLTHCADERGIFVAEVLLYRGAEVEACHRCDDTPDEMNGGFVQVNRKDRDVLSATRIGSSKRVSQGSVGQSDLDRCPERQVWASEALQSGYRGGRRLSE